MAYSTTTPNAGIAIPSTGCPDYESGNAIALLSAAVNKLDQLILNLETHTSAGAISSTIGKVILKAGSAAAMTLAAPTAGQPAAGPLPPAMRSSWSPTTASGMPNS